MKKDPCKGCSERWIDLDKGTRCHSTCQRYIAASQYKTHINSLIRKNHQEFNEVGAVIYKNAKLRAR